MSIALIQNSNELVVYTAGDGSQFNGLDMLLNAWLHGKSNNTKETYRRITRLFLESSQCDISKTGLIHLHQFIDTRVSRLTLLKLTQWLLNHFYLFVKN